MLNPCISANRESSDHQLINPITGGSEGNSKHMLFKFSPGMVTSVTRRLSLRTTHIEKYFLFKYRKDYIFVGREFKAQ